MSEEPSVLTRMRLSCCWGDNLNEKELNEVVDYINYLQQENQELKKQIDEYKEMVSNIEKPFENYLPIPNYEDNYLIDTFGNIKSLDKKVKNKNGYRIIKGKMLKPKLDKYGYLKIGLTKNNKQKHYFVHRLVAETFLPNPNNYKIINHIDGNKTNNYVENLEWCTQSHNVKEAYRIGIKKGVSAEHKGSKNPKSKLTEKEVLLILDNKNKGINIKNSYMLFEDKISFKGFEQIWYGYTWKHLVEKVDE